MDGDKMLHLSCTIVLCGEEWGYGIWERCSICRLPVSGFDHSTGIRMVA